MQTCARYGDSQPTLWLQALKYFAARAGGVEGGAAGSGAGGSAGGVAYVHKVLDAIERDRIYPPTTVLNALSEASDLRFGVVRDYLLRQVEHDASVEESKREAARYEADTKRMAGEVRSLTSEPRVFQLSKCSACHGQLELPTVHFLCMHSFHQVGGSKMMSALRSKSGICHLPSAGVPRRRGPRVRHLRAAASPRLRAHQAAAGASACINPQATYVHGAFSLAPWPPHQARAASHDDFFKQLELSSDGFSTVSDFFGRGMFWS